MRHNLGPSQNKYPRTGALVKELSLHSILGLQFQYRESSYLWVRASVPRQQF